MANCGSVTLGAIDARCDNSMGGIKRVLIANRDDVKATVTDGEITAITVESGKSFVEWKLTSDPTIGNSFATTEVNLQFSKAEQSKRLHIQSAINANAVVIVEDMYGQYIYLGLENEVTVTSATMVTGTASADLNGFTLVFQDIATELPHFVDKAIVDALEIEQA